MAEFCTDKKDSTQLQVYRRIDGQWRWFVPVGLASQSRCESVTSSDDNRFAFYNQVAETGVQVSYNPDQIDRRRVWVAPLSEQLNLELITKAMMLKPGQSDSFEYEFEFLDNPPEER
jgi:hypothetical protein